MRPIAVLVAGTYGLNEDWWKPQSKFCDALFEHRIRYADIYDPFVWCTSMEGLFGDNSIWETSGAALRWYCERKVRHYPLSIIAHSHGGQVAAYAAAQGLKVDRLITVATPVRGDMDMIYSKAKQNIATWIHIHSDTDVMQILGGLMDGKWGIHREMPYADNITVHKVSHRDFTNPMIWNRNDWWRYLL